VTQHDGPELVVRRENKNGCATLQNNIQAHSDVTDARGENDTVLSEIWHELTKSHNLKWVTFHS
jgi:hypothetical protein